MYNGLQLGYNESIRGCNTFLTPGSLKVGKKLCTQNVRATGGTIRHSVFVEIWLSWEPASR